LGEVATDFDSRFRGIEATDNVYQYTLGIRCLTVFVAQNWVSTLKRQLKTYISAKYWWQHVLSTLDIFLRAHYINLRLHLLTH